MNHAVECVRFIRDIAKKLNLTGSMYGIVKDMKEGPFAPDGDTRNRIIEFLENEHIEKLNLNVYNILHPGVSDPPMEDVDACSLRDLSPSQLVNYFGLVCYGVSYIEKDGLLLLKYNSCIWNTGWFDFAIASRGIVLDDDTLEVVGHPFDKFFNINEVPAYREEVIQEYLRQALSISFTDKKDGTLVAVYNYNGKTIVSTNGSLDNDHIKWAKALFAEKYSEFKPQDGYTYIFEMVIPETRVVIDYGETRKLYLIGIRNMETNRFLPYEELKEIAQTNKLDITEADDFSDLKTALEKAHSMKNANKEGWVLKITLPDKDVFVKIKLEEYFLLHRTVSAISLKRVYNLSVMGSLESFLQTATDAIKTDATEILEEINITREKYLEKVLKRAQEVRREFKIEEEGRDIPKEKIIAVVKKYGNSDILMGVKDPDHLRFNVYRASFKNFERYQKELEG